MDYTTLKITEIDDEIVIKKKPQIGIALLLLFILFCTFSVPLIYDNFWSKPIIGVTYYLFCTVMNIWFAISVIFGKIVICKLNREITIYNPIKHVVEYSDIRKIEIGGNDSYKMRFICSNKAYSFFIGGKKQAKEIEKLINSYIQIETENEDN